MRSVLSARYGLVLILLLGFLLRLAFAQASLDLAIRADEKDYTKLAYEILQDPLGYRGIFRPPLYPYVLASSFAVFGTTRFATGVMQALLATANIALVYALTQTLFRRRGVSLFAAFLFAVALEFVTITRIFFADSLFFLLSTLGFWLLFKWMRTPNARSMVLVGIVFALAALTREVLGLFALVVIPLWLVATLAPKWKQGISSAMLFLLSLAAVLVPWAIRNAPIEGRFVLISTSGEYNFARDNWREEEKVGITPSLEGVFISKPKRGKGKVTVNYMKQTYTYIREAPPAQRGATATELGMAVIRHNPLRWFLVKVHRLNVLLKPAPVSTPYMRLQALKAPFKTWLFVSNSILFYSILLCSAIGFLSTRDNAPKLLILLYLLFSLATFIITHYMPRYRLPFLILFFPYAAFGLVQVLSWIRVNPLVKQITSSPLRGDA